MGLSSGIIEIRQVFLFIFIVGPLALVVWKISAIIAFINHVRNSRTNELKRILESHDLSDEVRHGLKDEIERIVGYRITGISDVAIQKAIMQLYMLNRQSIQVGFFKKFRAFLVMENNELVFRTGRKFWIDNAILGLFSFQFLFISFSLLFLSLYKGQLIPLWVHFFLYLSAILLFLLFISFLQMIPRPKEYKLLKGMLQPQNVDI